MRRENEAIHQTRQRNRALVDDMCHGCCQPHTYCTLKEVLVRSPRDARTMVQLKCIEKLKYERSHAEGREIDWNEASAIWTTEGYAHRFSKLYHDGVRVSVLFNEIVNSPDLVLS